MENLARSIIIFMETRSKLTDAFGQELLDYYRGKETVEIIERDDGYIDGGAFGLKSYFSDYKDWFPVVEKRAIKFARGRVLDVGCGAGRHALYLQKKGFKVLGIDNSPLAVRVSKLRGVKKERVLPFEKVATLAPTKFGTILMLGHNFGLFGSLKKAKRLLKILRRLSTPEAVIIATIRDPYKTTSQTHKNYHKWNRRRGRMGGQIRMRVRHGKLASPWFDYLFVSQEELKQLIAGTGWKVKKFINDRGNPSYGVVLKKF